MCTDDVSYGCCIRRQTYLTNWVASFRDSFGFGWNTHSYPQKLYGVYLVSVTIIGGYLTIISLAVCGNELTRAYTLLYNLHYPGPIHDRDLVTNPIWGPQSTLGRRHQGPLSGKGKEPLALQISAAVRVWTADKGRSSLAAP
ncbi:hypothetical protein Scep_021737 [Stephania cephalantha]|uniref:Uncharacterized protein n=1 Tax=Stephania cephalantha TaxID=152367 RepID=A0AAP0HX37_9MAGN